MRGLADPQEWLTLADIDEAVAPFTFLPTLIGDDVAGERAYLITLEQVLDLEHKGDLFGSLLIGEVMRHLSGVLEGDANR